MMIISIISMFLGLLRPISKVIIKTCQNIDRAETEKCGSSISVEISENHTSL